MPYLTGTICFPFHIKMEIKPVDSFLNLRRWMNFIPQGTLIEFAFP